MTIHSMNRSAVIDSIKALASQVIVLHHFCVYAPMTDWLADAWPRIVELLHEDGRLAVQPFLVVGGFLAAQSLGKQVGPRLAPLIWRRYLRLAPQLALSLLLVMAATWWIGHELAHEDWLSPLPSAGVFLAHLFFLQDVLGIEAMSAGVWYLAIDLQLFASFVLLTQISRRAKVPLAQTYAPVLVAGATVTSVHIFSKASILDIWAIYYLSAYGLGALVIWARDQPAAESGYGSRLHSFCWTGSLTLAHAHSWRWQPRWPSMGSLTSNGPARAPISPRPSDTSAIFRTALS